VRYRVGLTVIAVVLFILCASPVAASGQSADRQRSDFIPRVKAPVTVGAADTIGTLVVVGNDASVVGNVTDLVVINGFARVSGTVSGNVTVINGTAELQSGGRITKDMMLYGSTLVRQQGALVEGTIHNERGLSVSAPALWMVWVSVTLALIVAGMILGYLAGPSLEKTAQVMQKDWPHMLLTTFYLVCGLPLIAVLAFMTGIGAVVGLFILFVLIPMLSLAGYLIAGTAFGRIILADRDVTREMFGPIAVGIVAIQLFALIPVIGGVMVILCSQLGAGAIVSESWRRTREKRSGGEIVLQPA